jgi:hypothetical protein
VQQARHAIKRGDYWHTPVSRRPVPAGLADQGHRLLMAARTGEGRRVIGARRHRNAQHWCDLAQHVSACGLPRCSATSPRRFRSARSRPDSREAFQAASANEKFEFVDTRSRTSRRSCAVRQRCEWKASSVGQVLRTEHKNDPQCSVKCANDLVHEMSGMEYHNEPVDRPSATRRMRLAEQGPPR